MDQRNATPEDHERHARFLNALRPWVQAVAVVLFLVCMWAVWNALP